VRIRPDEHVSSNPNRVRKLDPSDRSELTRMRQSLWPDSTASEVESLIAGTAEASVILVTLRGAGLCGFAEVGTRPYAEGCQSSPVAYLEGIWVDAAARRSGVASTLVREAERWARSQGLTELASDCDLTNLESQAFHAAVGFEEVQRLVVFRRGLQRPTDSVGPNPTPGLE